MNYELVYIITPELSEDEVKSKAKEVSDLLKKTEAKVLKEDFWGKKELAYSIKHFEEGWYVLCEFSAEPEKIKEIDKALKLQEDIFRFLITKKELKKALKEKKLTKIVKEKEEVKPSKEVPEERVELEKLDKKLEEILGGKEKY